MHQRRRGGGPRDEFTSKTIDLARVTRVMAGGKRMRFRACIVAGDRKGRVGSGVAKGADVEMSINKATAKAKKHLITVPMKGKTIPHQVTAKYSAAVVFLKPAPPGTGVKAGGAVRIVLDLVGIQDIIGKIMGSKNKINNVRATLLALSQLRSQKSVTSNQ